MFEVILWSKYCHYQSLNFLKWCFVLSFFSPQDDELKINRNPLAAKQLFINATSKYSVFHQKKEKKSFETTRLTESRDNVTKA